MKDSKFREQWLECVAEDIAAIINSTGEYTVPAYNISCGFPSRRALVDDPPVVDIWFGDQTSNGVAQIYVNPRETNYVTITTFIEDALCKLSCDCRGKATKEVNKLVESIKEPVTKVLDTILPRHGAYPQSAINIEKKERKQTTRMRKLSCSGFNEKHEQYILRGSKKVLDLGVPDCPICRVPMWLEPEENKDDDES